jgi:hypothetical protein
MLFLATMSSTVCGICISPARDGLPLHTGCMVSAHIYSVSADFLTIACRLIWVSSSMA